MDNAVACVGNVAPRYRKIVILKLQGYSSCHVAQDCQQPGQSQCRFRVWFEKAHLFVLCQFASAARQTGHVPNANTIREFRLTMTAHIEPPLPADARRENTGSHCDRCAEPRLDRKAPIVHINGAQNRSRRRAPVQMRPTHQSRSPVRNPPGVLIQRTLTV